MSKEEQALENDVNETMKVKKTGEKTGNRFGFFQKYPEWVIGGILGVLHSQLVEYTYHVVPEPYMDEIFHVRQARQYCANDFSRYDPMITTPPALYFLTMLLSFPCGQERYTNSIIIPFTFVAFFRLRRQFSSSSTTLNALTCLSVLSLPILFHPTLLYYTDLLSLTAVIWGMSLMEPGKAAVCFSLAVFTRQTNIVWAGVYGVIRLVQTIDPNRIRLSIEEALYRLRAFIYLALLFLAFFIHNGGTVVLGDRTAHKPVPHFMQLYYMAVTIVAFGAPYLLMHGHVIRGVVAALRRPISSLFACAIIAIGVYNFTFEHPYLLADNRHFTFYIWRRWFRREWWCRYAVIPIYLFCLHIIQDSVKHLSPLLIGTSIAATAAVLVPANLIEPRYFILPYVLWRLSLKESDRLNLFLEILFNILINTIVLYLFYEKPFKWANKPDEIQRFMW
ncbi:hypothetical protein AB6A40_005640 [Gnathostoma spinigerum]|uniref:Dol-P-Glc:Glc(2)Man(9)GlcNAc(2)-PP-Dol alpha-1,2-glucosyltransferase n=1 Tax=Gnathostoma spinigerum TaxID=75299 RepID=A0ABD6EI65_9BILA